MLVYLTVTSSITQKGDFVYTFQYHLFGW